ncbi:efflux RND transporter permease subunit [Halopseudomonas salegens]|uniref:Multidrug efflux pump subunit AcrB n=1 Tax=Halopseudomonas salegens TaxID=1434072 RepID=A0A1H2FTN3_9GAMM|nr:efflux RND transporter permease subunit [Halopseudomonas salegens]SDU10694.1 Multidrug efflux pump subunit AcrB [Halopseudomonas salegens]
MSRWLAGRPRLIGLVVTMLCLLGLSSYFNMARQEDPSFPYRAALLTVIYPGADAESIERLVLRPLSDELLQVDEVNYFTANARNGVALITLQLRDVIYDTDSAWDRVRQAMQRAELEMPDGIQRMSLDDRLIDIPAVVLALRGDASLVTLSQEAERLKRAMMDIPALSRIEVDGQADEQITIALRDSDLQRFGVSRNQLISRLSERNQVLPGGFVSVAEQRLSLLPNSEFVSLDELALTQIGLPDGSSVSLSALADIWRGPVEPYQPRAWFASEQAVMLSLIPRRGQLDAVAFGQAVRQRLQELRGEFAPLEIDEVYFQPDLVVERLDSLERSLLGSVLIIVGVVLLGMGWRMGLLVASMLPLVVLISLGIYNLGGGILHQIAVTGIVISLGVLIDNAIVMVENIQHRLSSGQPRAEAAQDAIKEMAGPLGASTATTLAAFTPLLLSKGATADFTRGIPVMIMLTLTISYLMAVTACALLASKLLHPGQRAQGRWMQWLSGLLAEASRRAPGLLVLMGAVMVVLSVGMSPWLQTQFFPNADRPLVIAELYLPVGSDQSHTMAVASEVEGWLLQRDDVQRIDRFAGYAGPSFYYNLMRAPESPHRARLVIHTRDLASTRTIMDELREYSLQQHPSLELVTSILGQGPPRLAPVEVRLYHVDEQQRHAAAEQVFAALRSVEGTADVRHDIDLGVPAIKVRVDDAQAERFGLSRADVARNLFGRSLGARVELYRQEREPIPMVLRTPEGTQQDIRQLASGLIISPQGNAVPLSALASLEPVWETASIRQRNGVRVTTVSANLQPGFAFSQVQEALQQHLGENPLPAGTRLEYGGDSEGSGDANSALATTAPVGILLLLFFLLWQFNSFRRVGIILLTVPLAAVGVVPGLVLTGSPFGFQSMLGVIALVGIVVNNAIVLIDLIDQRLASGASVADAVAEAVQRRTRPILLTTATTVAGLLPLALSSSTLWPPMAWAIISGLLASTFLTLLVIPALCRLTLKPVGVPNQS